MRRREERRIRRRVARWTTPCARGGGRGRDTMRTSTSTTMGYVSTSTSTTTARSRHVLVVAIATETLTLTTTIRRPRRRRRITSPLRTPREFRRTPRRCIDVRVCVDVDGLSRASGDDRDHQCHRHRRHRRHRHHRHNCHHPYYAVARDDFSPEEEEEEGRRRFASCSLAFRILLRRFECAVRDRSRRQW